jgi:TP901 family phage tail tape measure protein
MNVVLKLTDEMSAAVKKTVDNSKSALDDFSKHAEKVGQDLSQFGRRVGAVGLGISAALGTTVKQFADLEQGMASLKSTMMTKDGLSGNFERVSELAIKLGNQLPGNTRDFTVMINKLLQLGVAEEDVLGGVGEAAAKLAAVMELPYEEAATVAAKLKEVSGVAEVDMLKFMDTLQRVGHQGVSATEMMTAFGRSGGGLKQFAIQGEEATRSLSAFFAILLKSGLSGETAGTNTVTLLNRLAKFEFDPDNKMKEAAAKLRQFGVELDFFDDKTKEFKGIENMVAQLSKLQGLNQEQLTGSLQGIFGGGQDQQIAALIAQGGTGKFEAMRARMDNQADLATRAAERATTLSAKWETAFGTFENLLAKIGSLLAPKLGEFVDWFGAVSERLFKWIDENRGLAETLAVVVGGIGAALTALGAAGLTAGAIAAAFGAVASGLSAIAGAATAALPAMVALAANPVVLVLLTGAGAFMFGRYINEQITTAMSALTGTQGETLGTALFGVVEYTKEQLGKLPKIVSDAATSAIKAVRDFHVKMFEAGKYIIDGLIAGVKAKGEALVQGAKDLATSVVDKIRNVLDMRSPSQVMYQLGLDTASGYALGLQAGAEMVGTAAAAMATTLPTAAQAGSAAAAESESQYTQEVVRYREINLKSAGYFFSQLGALMTTKSKALFQVGKAAAIAETIVNTYRAAQGAFAALASIPYVGYALGAAAAAAATAAGLARVQSIRSTDMGGASGSPVLSGGGFSGPVIAGDAGVSVPPSPVTAPQQAPAAPREVNVYVRGSDVFSAQTIRDSLIPALNDALGDGVTLNVRYA